MKRRLGGLLMAGAVVLAAVASIYAVRGTSARREATRVAAVHRARGIDLYRRGDPIHAEDELRAALRTDPDDWQAPFYVGVIQIQRGRHGLAVPYLERALNLNPREAKVLNALGVAYFKMDRLDMAKAYFRASLDLDPANQEARGMLETMAKMQHRASQATKAGD